MSLILEVRDVKKSYRLGRILVPDLCGVSFDAREGEFLAVFGPSGSGKSTLLHLLGGLDRPDEGEILIGGCNILRLSDSSLAELRLTKTGFIFQFLNLLPRMTALNNVELPLTIAGVSDKEASDRAKQMLKLVGLDTRENHRPYELSGGEQQRVAIARALITNPKIVLADEPTGNLDTKTGGEIVQMMKRLKRERSQTFIVVTHDPRVADEADRTIHLQDGLIETVTERNGKGARLE
jgi:putative ABC transport system ATP-binding protein